MRISEPSKEDVRRVALNMRQRDFDEFSAVSFASSREELAELMAERYGARSDAMVASAGDEPICVGATVMARPNVVSLLFFATDRFPEIALPITRFIRRQLFPRLVKSGVHRIEAVSMCGYEQTHGWLRTLGLDQETQAMHGYGKNGEAFIQFAWSSDVRPTGA